MKQKTHAAEHTEEHAQSRSMMQEVWRRFKKNKGAVVGLCIFLVICVLAISAGFVYDYDTQVVGGDVPQRLQSPSWEHPFGTDEMGRDILIRVIYGARYSLSVGVVAVAIALVIGVSLGALAGYVGGITENIIMRITDIFIAVPNILLAIAIVSAMGQSTLNLMIAVGICSSASFVQISRAAVLTVRNNEYVEAARTIGLPNRIIIIKHVLPNVINSIIVLATIQIGSFILTEATLSFLGVGVPITQPSLGLLVKTGFDVLFSGLWWASVFPGLYIMLIVFGINLLGDFLRDELNPNLK